MKANIKIIISGTVIALIFFIVYFIAFQSKLDINGDNANYILLARNISRGYGYSHFTPSGIMHVNFYPPGYPFLLSIFMMLGISSLIFFKVFNGVLLLVSLMLLGYMVYKLTDNYVLGFVVALIPIFSSQLQHFASMVMSEMPYLFFTVLCLFSLYKYQSGGKKEFWKSPWFYLSIVFAVISYHIRQMGMTCLFALIVFFFFRKEWKEALCACGGIILLLLPWSLRNHFYGLKSRYFETIMSVNPWRPEMGTISSFNEMWKKMIANFDNVVIKGFQENLFPFVHVNYGKMSSIAIFIVGFLILAFIILGAWRIVRLRWFLISYLIANIGLFMLWHGGNKSRYVVSILPIVYLCFYVGIYAAFELLFNRLKLKKVLKYLPVVFLVALIPMFSAMKTLAAAAKAPYSMAYKNYFYIAKKINNDAKYHSKVICCRKPELFEYFAPNVYTIRYLYSKDTYEVLQNLIENRVDYVVLEQLGFSSTKLYLYPALKAHGELFFVIEHIKNPDTFLLRFDRKNAMSKVRAYKLKQ